MGSKILLLGESLPKNGWMDSGRAFYTKEGKLAPTGKKLNEELAVLNLSAEDCFLQKMKENPTEDSQSGL